MQKSIMEKYKDGAVEQRYRTIVRGVPEENEAIINIPLVKKSYKQNFIVRFYNNCISLIFKHFFKNFASIGDI